MQWHGERNKWDVHEQVSIKRRPDFNLRQDVVSRAISLAERQLHAAVEVHGKDGGLIWCETDDAVNNPRSKSTGYLPATVVQITSQWAGMQLSRARE